MNEPAHAGTPLTRTVAAMAMDFTLQAWGPVDPESVDVVMGHIAADLRWADQVFSTYREDSWISRLGRGEARVADAPPAVAEVLDLCEQFREETGGAFDARTPAGGVDPSGIVKTWAMERARWRLSLVGATGWLWGCAGDVTVSGHGPVDGAWRVGIADPREQPGPHQSTLVDTVVLGGRESGTPRATALATSGTAHRSGHIWDPRRGQPAQHFAQASVMGADLVRCDAWATAIVAAGRSAALAAQEQGLEVCAVAVREGKAFAQSSPGWRSAGGRDAP